MLTVPIPTYRKNLRHLHWSVEHFGESEVYHIFLYNIGYEVGSAKIWNFKFCSIFTKVFIIYESWCRDRSSSVEMTTVEDCIRRLALWAENPSWGLKINALTSSGKKSRSPNMENWNDGAIILFKYGPIFLYFRMSWQRIQSSGRLTELKSVFVCGQWPKDLIITWVVVVALDASLYTSAVHFGLHFLGTRLSCSSGLNLSAHLGPGLVQSTHCYTAILTDLENDFYRSRKQSIFI